MKNVGLVEISDAALLCLLKIPEGVLNGIKWNAERRVLLLNLVHPEFTEEVAEGASLRAHLLVFRTHECGHVCEIGRHRETTREPFAYGGTTMRKHLMAQEGE